MTVSSTGWDKNDVLTYHAVPHWGDCKTQGFINCLHLPNNCLTPHQCLTNGSLLPFFSSEQRRWRWNAQLWRKWAGESEVTCMQMTSAGWLTDHTVSEHAEPLTFSLWVVPQNAGYGMVFLNIRQTMITTLVKWKQFWVKWKIDSIIIDVKK